MQTTLTCEYCGCSCAERIEVTTLTPKPVLAELRAKLHYQKDVQPPSALCAHCRAELKAVLLEGGEKKFRFACVDLLITASMALDDALEFVKHGSADELWALVWRAPAERECDQ
jgi:hypothetical protein